MTLQTIVTLLRSSDAKVRRAGWGNLWELRGKLSLGQRDLADLADRALNEPDVDIMCLARGIIAALHDLKTTVLQDLLWAPFDSRRSRRLGVGGGAAVVAVSDEHAVPDALSLVGLAQCLPDSRDIDYRTTDVARPEWHSLHLAGLRTICMVGRPPLYREFVLSQFTPDLRFRFPEDDAQWRGKPPTRESANCYHRVEQWWANERTRAFEVREDTGAARVPATRVDYAVVQRYAIAFEGRQIVVVVLAGATSLGTAGAVQWATRDRFDLKRVPAMERYQQPITDETRIEVLLEVAGTLHTPRRPWAPRVRVEKLFLNDSQNLVSSGPSRIRLVGGLGGADKVTAIYLDDDGVPSGSEEYSALIPLCLKAHQSPKHIVSLRDLMTDLSVWPGQQLPGDWGRDERVKNYFLDTLQRRLLNGQLHVHEKVALRLDSAIELA